MNTKNGRKYEIIVILCGCKKGKKRNKIENVQNVKQQREFELRNSFKKNEKKKNEKKATMKNTNMKNARERESEK